TPTLVTYTLSLHDALPICGRALAPPTGTGRLRNVAQGMCLDVAGWAAQGNSNVLLGECNNDPDHVWSFTPDGELRNTLNGTCLRSEEHTSELQSRGHLVCR